MRQKIRKLLEFQKLSVLQKSKSAGLRLFFIRGFNRKFNLLTKKIHCDTMILIKLIWISV